MSKISKVLDILIEAVCNVMKRNELIITEIYDSRNVGTSFIHVFVFYYNSPFQQCLHSHGLYYLGCYNEQTELQKFPLVCEQYHESLAYQNTCTSEDIPNVFYV